MHPNLENPSFWQVYLACTADWTTVPEIAELYGKTPHSFYGEDGIIARMVADGALEEAERMKTSYRTNLNYDPAIQWGNVLEPVYTSFFTHSWIKHLVPDVEIRAARPDEIFNAIRLNVVWKATIASDAVTEGNPTACIRKVINSPINIEMKYPTYVADPRLFDTLLRLRSLLYMMYEMIERRKGEEPEHEYMERLNDAQEARLRGEMTNRELLTILINEFKPMDLDDDAAEILVTQITQYLEAAY